MEILGNKPAIKLLKVLVENPLKEFKEIELINKAKTGKGSASIILKTLINQNILAEKRVGKTKLISINTHKKNSFLLKNILNNEKMYKIEKIKSAAIFLFKNKIKKSTRLIIAFGSCIAGTATKKSDIDLLIVTNNLNKIEKERKEIEELFGEHLNLHHYTENEIKTKINKDMFIKNAFFNGVIIHGYDLGEDLFSNLKEKKDIERLFFLHGRIKSSLRNYIEKDNKTAKEILEKTIEQLIFYLLSENKIQYESKKNSRELIKELPENVILQKINKSQLKEKINLTEELIIKIIKDTILSGEGYA